MVLAALRCTLRFTKCSSRECQTRAGRQELRQFEHCIHSTRGSIRSVPPRGNGGVQSFNLNAIEWISFVPTGHCEVVLTSWDRYFALSNGGMLIGLSHCRRTTQHPTVQPDDHAHEPEQPEPGAEHKAIGYEPDWSVVRQAND